MLLLAEASAKQRIIREYKRTRMKECCYAASIKETEKDDALLYFECYYYIFPLRKEKRNGRTSEKISCILALLRTTISTENKQMPSLAAK